MIRSGSRGHTGQKDDCTPVKYKAQAFLEVWEHAAPSPPGKHLKFGIQNMLLRSNFTISLNTV